MDPDWGNADSPSGKLPEFVSHHFKAWHEFAPWKEKKSHCGCVYVLHLAPFYSSNKLSLFWDLAETCVANAGATVPNPLFAVSPVSIPGLFTLVIMRSDRLTAMYMASGEDKRLRSLSDAYPLFVFTETWHLGKDMPFTGVRVTKINRCCFENV